MEREIVLSSYLDKIRANNKPVNFVTTVIRPITLYQYVVGLNRILNTSFTLFNIILGYSNPLIKY